MYYRIRLINTDSRIEVRDMAFSQTVELLNGLDHSERKAFWHKEETKLPDGRSAYLVREGV